MEEIRQSVIRDEQYILALRRKLHQYPELSTKEMATTALIAAELKALGVRCNRLAWRNRSCGTP